MQLPLVERVLATNPGVEYHVWNLARNADDCAYVRSLSGERIEVIDGLYGDSSWQRFDDVYRHYSKSEYSEHLFVKIDDDVVFFEADRFSSFVETVRSGSVVSAHVVNNGACTVVDRELWKLYAALDIPLLDVHLSGDYARVCHDHFLRNWSTMVGRPVTVIPTRQWLSINLIGVDWATMCQIATRVGTMTPPEIAGRHFGQTLLGDEGMVNTLPRLIVQGFTAAHLSFGPQVSQIDAETWALWRRRYGDLGREYLA